MYRCISLAVAAATAAVVLAGPTLGLAAPRRQTPLSANGSPDSVHDLLKKAQIIPTILHDFAPLCLLEIHYSSGSSVHYGNELSPDNTTAAPAFEINCPDGVAFEDDDEELSGFVIALTDPDAPSRTNPKWSEMAHWAVAFDAGGSMKNNMTEIVQYKAPGPPKGTGKHRYVFVLMAGDISDLKAPAQREHWGYGKGKGKKHRKTKGVQKWSDQSGLSVVGANWFVAKHDG